MGGTNEKVLEQQESKAKSADKTKGKGIEVNLPSVRIHGVQGEVHFHADAEKLKVAVPTSIWYRAWERLERGEITSWIYYDSERATELCVSIDESDGIVDATVEIFKVNVGGTFAQLQKFHEGR